MGYKLIGYGDIDSPIDTILKNRGIEEGLFEVDESSEEDYLNFDNIMVGVELLISNLDYNKKILMIVDSDMDGHSSFALIYNYIKEIYPNANIEYVLHKGKEHGLDDIEVEDDVSLVIVADAGTTDFVQHKELKDRNIDVLVLDHHKADTYSEHAIVINNQLSKNIKNKNLSGVGVCYKFIRAMDDYLGEELAYKYMDLNCLGNVADVMNLHEKETRYYVYEGLKKTNNLFIKALKEMKAYDLDGKFNISKLGWTIAPIVNGTIRSGTIKEKTDMVKAFISDDYAFCLKVANACKNAKARQDGAVKRAMTKLLDEIELNENKCLLLHSGTLSSSHRGLVAGKLADKYGVPVLIYTERKDGTLGGSFRGVDNISLNLYEDISKSGIAEVLGGHDQAGGWSCPKDKLDDLQKYFNKLYEDKEISTNKEFEVDFIVDQEELEQWMVDELASLEDECGNGIDRPLLAIQNVELEITATNIKATNIIFTVNGIKYIKKYATKILKESLLDNYIQCDIIGSCSINSYDGVGQIEVEDIIIY